MAPLNGRRSEPPRWFGPTAEAVQNSAVSRMWWRGRRPIVVAVTTVARHVTRGVAPRRDWLPPRVDVALAGAFVAMSLAEALVSGTVRSPWQHFALGGSAMVLLAWRRRWPLAVAAVVVASDLALNPDRQFSTLLSLVLVCYTIGAETVPPRSHVGLAVVVVPFVAAMAVAGLVPSDIGAALVFLVGPWAVGSAVRQRSETAREATSRADRLEQESRLEAARVAAEERTRIARELHDIVSHSLSVVTIQTQAVRRRLGPDHAAEAADLAAVETTARDALAEMRRLFGVLRAEGESAALAPQPGLADLSRLVEHARSAGVAARLLVEGEPRDLPPGVDLAAYRIVQEGVTNALRHAGASRLEVTVRYAPAALHLAVEDDGRGLGGPVAGGHGIVGIRERVALYGGTVAMSEAGGGGVRLDAVLPLAGPG